MHSLVVENIASSMTFTVILYPIYDALEPLLSKAECPLSLARVCYSHNYQEASLHGCMIHEILGSVRLKHGYESLKSSIFTIAIAIATSTLSPKPAFSDTF